MSASIWPRLEVDAIDDLGVHAVGVGDLARHLVGRGLGAEDEAALDGDAVRDDRTGGVAAEQQTGEGAAPERGDGELVEVAVDEVVVEEAGHERDDGREVEELRGLVERGLAEEELVAVVQPDRLGDDDDRGDHEETGDLRDGAPDELDAEEQRDQHRDGVGDGERTAVGAVARGGGAVAGALDDRAARERLVDRRLGREPGHRRGPHRWSHRGVAEPLRAGGLDGGHVRRSREARTQALFGGKRCPCRSIDTASYVTLFGKATRVHGVLTGRQHAVGQRPARPEPEGTRVSGALPAGQRAVTRVRHVSARWARSCVPGAPTHGVRRTEFLCVRAGGAGGRHSETVRSPRWLAQRTCPASRPERWSRPTRARVSARTATTSMPS
ncbi:MAG: hypothetical protein PGN13_06015 [Patulibacter minatonensis]